MNKEEIESLGWIQYSHLTERTVGFKLNDYKLFYNFESNRLRIGKNTEEEIIGYKEYFDGKITNPSELKVLMKQLNINE
ncbi:MAG TPA: hypothetical protein VF680_16900 [Allosphingosinicella sp.]|jgi:hypothetical protein